MNKSEVGKRVLDLAFVVLSAPIVLPLCGVTALAIRLETPGGAIFYQTRLGRFGQKFTVYKLRTMIENAENIGAGLYNAPGDTRYTKVGTLARRFSVDEVPQLLNVIRGEMSVVGPRPALAEVVERYAGDYAEIHQVKPGLTGLAQISGRNALPRSARLRLDREYARTWSVLGDIGILLRTFRVVLGGEGQLNNQAQADVEQ